MSLPTLEWQFLSRKGGPYVSQPGACSRRLRCICSSLNRKDLAIVPFLQISSRKHCFVSQFSLERRYGAVWSLSSGPGGSHCCEL